MTLPPSESLRVVCEAADAWAGEYGFTSPDEATAVKAAIYAAERRQLVRECGWPTLNWKILPPPAPPAVEQEETA